MCEIPVKPRPRRRMYLWVLTWKGFAPMGLAVAVFGSGFISKLSARGSEGVILGGRPAYLSLGCGP